MKRVSTATPKNSDALRVLFEQQCEHCGMGFRLSRKGVYVNPATALKWRWFINGFATATLKGN